MVMISNAFSSLRTKANFAILAFVLTGIYWALELYLATSWQSMDDGMLDFILDLEDFWPILFLLTAVLFVVWSYGAHLNLDHLGRDGQMFSNGATVWWWLIPFANFFMPFRTMYETVRGSTAPLGDPSWSRYRLEPVAIWWTILFLGGLAVSQAADTRLDQASSISEFDAAINVFAVGSAGMVGAAIAAGVLVSKVTARQLQLGRQVASQPSTPVTGGAAANSGQRACSNCGSPHERGDRFCASCGQPLSQG